MTSNNTSREESFFKDNTNLIYFLSNQLAKKYNLSTEDKEELVSAAKLALWKTCYEQDINAKGVRSYLYLRVKGQMIDLLRKKRQILKIKVKTNQLTAEAPLSTADYPFLNPPADTIKAVENKLTLNAAYKNLSSKEKKLIRKHYYQDKQFKDIFNNKSKSWVSKFHQQTLKKLRHIINMENLQERISKQMTGV